MRIGIDFDNTLAIYDRIFTMLARKYGYVNDNENLSKDDIKKAIFRMEDGELKWQKLQGQAYGKYMGYADMARGAGNFLLRSKLRGHDIFIVSHKTEFGHYDESRTPLRDEALKWMVEKNFFTADKFCIDKKNIFFLDTREEKILKIAELECDYFIDDLVEVLENISFPNPPKRILYGSEPNLNNYDFPFAPSWEEVSIKVLGEEGIDDIAAYTAALLDAVVKNVAKVVGRGNSAIFKVETDLGNFSLKRYPYSFTIDGGGELSRIESEVGACNYLRDNGVKNIRNLRSYSTELNVAIFDWIEGGEISSITDADVLTASNFIESLYFLAKNKSAQVLKNAKEACFTTSEIFTQIENREKLLESSMLHNFELRDFLVSEYYPLRDKIFDSSRNNVLWKSRDVILDRKFHTLSPSDFGFHNAIKTFDNKIHWLDFEYFGWDDPVKLVSDFMWHPGMNLSEYQRKLWLKEALIIFGHDQFFEERLRMHYALYGLRWILIILNPFAENFWKEKVGILQFKLISKNDFLSQRLVMARHVISRLSHEYLTKSILES